MSFTNSHNLKRVDRILADLALIEKSAASNRADPEDIRLLLTPVFNELRQMGFAATANAAQKGEPHPEPVQEEDATESVGGTSRARVGFTAPPWADVIEMARQASLRDLTRAMAIYLDRIDDAFAAVAGIGGQDDR